MSITIELSVIFGLILANGFFAAAEIAILTSRRNRLEQRANAGSRRAAIALDLAMNPSRFLPTVQVGITLVGTLTSVFGGATLVSYLAQRLSEAANPLVAQRCQTIALAIVVLGITFLSLVFGELVPKQLALARAERLAEFVAPPMHWLALVARPVVWLMGAASQGILAVLPSRQASESTVSVEDIESLIRAGTRAGILAPAEQMVVRRALHLGDRVVREIMRPRIEIDALDIDTPPEEVIGAVAMAGFSRLPIHEGDLDHIIGFLYTKDLLLRQHMGWPIELRKLIRPALLVPETLAIDRLVELFRQKRTQMAIVLDEFGGTEGLVTLEDVLEELVGEVHDEYRRERKPEIVERGPGTWLVAAGVSVNDLLERIPLEPLRTEALPDVSTVGGLVLSLLGRIPKVADRVEWNGLSLEVVEMQGRRVEQVLIKRMKKEA
ncbi:MAG: hemolysin family protein [Thermoguttaceae bacterium]|jgi:putative hemolysin